MGRGFSCFLFFTLSLLQPLTAQTPPPADLGKIIREDWEIVLIQNKRCGYGSTIVRERTTPVGKQYITDQYQEFRLKRDAQELHMISRSSIVESEDGVVISFQSESSGAGSNQVARGYRIGDELVIMSGGQKVRAAMPRSLLGPQAIDNAIRGLKFETGTNASYVGFDADFPQTPVTMTVRVAGRETIAVRGQSRELWKVVMGISILPGMDSVAYCDEHAEPELVIVTFPGIGEMRMETTTRAEAMKELESIELYANSLITPKQPLEQAHTRKSATFRLSTSNGSSPLTLWSGPEQKIIESKPGQSTIQILVPQFNEKNVAWQLPHAADPALDRYLAASFYIEQTPRIQALAKEAVGDEKNPILAARKIEAFVRRYIRTKDLNVAFATADETAASREGDCTEHAVLCAALGRAVGLPTRTVVGLGYLPPDFTHKADTGTFGFHMWAEAWIGPEPEQWIAMDAALGQFDAGHIAIAKTALQEVNPMAELALPVLGLMQNLQIEVLDPKP